MRFALQCDIGNHYWGPSGRRNGHQNSSPKPIWMTQAQLDEAFALHLRIFNHKPNLHRIIEEVTLGEEPE